MSSLSKKQKGLIFGGTAAVLVLAVALVALVVAQPFAKPADAAGEGGNATSVPSQDLSISTPDPDLEGQKQKEEVAAIISRTTMLPGTTVNGIDIGGMTLSEAEAAVNAALQQQAAAINLTLLNGTDPIAVTAEDVTAVFDPASVLQDAYNLVRDSLNYEETMAKVQDIAANGAAFTVPLTLEEGSVMAYVESLAQDIDTPAVNATVTTVDKKLSYTEEQKGRGIDQTALVAAILAADASAGQSIAIPMVETEPALTKEMLETQYVLRGSFTTSFSGSTSNRKFNIRKGAELINGTVLQPGEVFSTNGVLGTRTTANGWKMAGAYESGDVVQQAGGGVCQLSSTLYNACLYADLKIVYRQNHSMPVSYVKKGRDATINSVGNIIDYQFSNNTSGPIVVISYTEGNNLHMEIYGLPFETEEYDKIEITTKKLKTISITTKITYDDTKSEDYEEVTFKGSTGYVYETFKEYYKGSKLVKTESLGQSNYKMFQEEVTKGTKVSATASATASAGSTPAPTLRPPDETPTPTAVPPVNTPVLPSETEAP